MTEPAPKPEPKRPRKDQGKRQTAHRDKITSDGGRYLTVELDQAASMALAYIQARDKLKYARQAVEESLELNAKHGHKLKPPKD